MLYTSLPCGHLPGVANVAPPKEALNILFLNLMPIKATTEVDFCRSLAFQDIEVNLLPMKIANQRYKCTPQEYVETYYNDFETYADKTFDAMIITGAPLENMPFEDVRYWEQLTSIMTWAQTHVHSTLYVCWGAQAGLYYNFGIPKYPLPAKRFGIFQHRPMASHLLLKGLSPQFPMPHSRHTEVRAIDFPKECTILAESEESGVGLAISNCGREVYITGHLEYAPQTLHEEYVRDLSKNLPIAAPLHYYNDNDATKGINFSWQEACRHFYHNWLELVESFKQL